MREPKRWQDMSAAELREASAVELQRAIEAVPEAERRRAAAARRAITIARWSVTDLSRRLGVPRQSIYRWAGRWERRSSDRRRYPHVR